MARYPSIVTVVVVLALVRLGCGRDNRAPINMLGVIFGKTDGDKHDVATASYRNDDDVGRFVPCSK